MKSLWPRRSSRHTTRGFTLVEILVTVVIIGVIVSVVTLSVNVLGRDREAEEQARRFWAVLQQAREEAELQGIDIGVYVTAEGYEFLRYDAFKTLWVPLQGDALYVPRQLPEGLRFRAWLEGREIVLKPSLPQREDDAENQKYPPQIMVLSSGETMPFELQIERDRGEALWRVLAQPDNDLRVERRQDREWIVMGQTLPPPTDEDDRRAATKN